MIKIKSITTTHDERIIIGDYYGTMFRLCISWGRQVPVYWSVYPSEHVLEDKSDRPIETIFDELDKLVTEYSE